ncbi:MULTISPECIES: DUF3159 domain-containing protein [unclassified Microbacterium]|uniref:DUF3159 domain-containing protein n=1 Tax=unclassified Microbacterium TaxID=2609290 RepID=UPI00097EDD86|nr:DUF3159 domain-containing protein [Microbacterium sp. JB110]RCS63209.1 DUF3159 domain-containing protein [Microbacterium sp. JB110]SJM52359.1 PROBABLE CONSERVED INTEGRAL MEMBRANE ALANINE AND LEUCINE RICH PROTEIN [Frigoribacterium sp. JB110]
MSDARPDDAEGRDGDAAGRTPLTPPAAEPAEPSASEVLGQAVDSAARRAGIDPNADEPTARVVWRVIGGWRGVAESVLPLLGFVVAYTVTGMLLLSLVISVGAAAVFTIIRLVMKSPPIAALSGLIAAVIAAGIPLVTGRAEDQFVIGFITNIAYGSAFVISALVRWPLIGVISGFLVGEGLAWREDRRKRRVFFWLSMAWGGLFALRLGVQLPFYFAEDIATLGTVKIIMGIPLFALLLAGTWLAARRLYPRTEAPDGRSDAEHQA